MSMTIPTSFLFPLFLLSATHRNLDSNEKVYIQNQKEKFYTPFFGVLFHLFYFWRRRWKFLFLRVCFCHSCCNLLWFFCWWTLTDWLNYILTPNVWALTNVFAIFLGSFKLHIDFFFIFCHTVLIFALPICWIIKLLHFWVFNVSLMYFIYLRRERKPTILRFRERLPFFPRVLLITTFFHFIFQML